MRTINMHEAKTRLSALVDKAVTLGESFVIAKSGKPMVKVTPLERAQGPRARIGFMKGRISVPVDFDRLHEEEIETQFTGRS